jgi:hypothetical protein
MNEERSRILDLLATGKITAEEAARLLDALEARAADARAKAGGPSGGQSGNPSATAKSATPKFMYVKVVSTKGDNVNVKIPLSLVRAGLKLTSLIPAQAVDQINKSMADHGMSVDLSNLKPDDLEELIESLREMEISVDAANGDNVRVYCA